MCGKRSADELQREYEALQEAFDGGATPTEFQDPRTGVMEMEEKLQELSYREREMRAEARGYEAWRVGAFVDVLRRNKQHLLDFFFYQHRSICTQASEPVNKLIDSFVHDHTHWERANIMYRIADDINEMVVGHAKYLVGIARELDRQVKAEAEKPERKVHQDIVCNDIVFSVTEPTKEQVERQIRAEFARQGMTPQSELCVVCKANWVDTANGEDTCRSCLKQQ